MIWELIYRLGVDVFKIWKAYVFPSPIRTLKAMYELILDKSIFIAIFYSLRRLFIAYAISSIIGILLGFIIYRSGNLGTTLKSLILGLQSLPSLCWVPFALLWFGLGEIAIIFIVIISSVFSIALSVSEAIENILPIYIKAAKTMGIKEYSLKKNGLFRKVILPAGLPTIFTGLKQGWAFAWRALVAGEMIASSEGLGHILILGRDFQDIAKVAAIMISIIFIGLLLDKFLFSNIEKDIRAKWGFES